MTSSHPSVKHLSLSGDRVSKVISEMIESFEKNATGRKIIRPIYLTMEDRRREESGFISLGVSHITDKIWFVDGVFGDMSYGYQGIGMDYGRGLAEAEASHVAKCIVKECRENTVTFDGEVHPSDILRSLEYLEQRKVEAKIMLTNVHDHIKLWHHGNMVTQGRLCISRFLSGYNHDIEIEFLRELPEGTSIILDPHKIGELLIKQTVKDVADISEIGGSEKEKILGELPSMTPEKLDESVRILVYEVIKVRVTEPNAAVILQKRTKDNDKQFLLV